MSKIEKRRIGAEILGHLPKFILLHFDNINAFNFQF